MALLLKSGKQILRLSSSSVKSRQQLGIGISANKYLSTTTTTSNLGAFNKYYSSTTKTQNDDVDSIVEMPRSWKSYFISFFSRKKSPPPTLFQDLLWKFLDLAEQSKYCSKHRLPRIYDEIRPILIEVLYRMSEENIVKFVYEFARPAASPSCPPPMVIDTKIKQIVDILPTHVIHLFQDMMINMLQLRFRDGISFNLRFEPEPERKSESIVITADVSCIRKEHLKVFIVKNFLMITGTDKAASADATIQQIINLPISEYCYDEHTASIIEGSQLKIVFPCHYERKAVNVPRVFQLNLDTEGTHQA